jgi:peptidoglycan/LPS O-acetylase OafA/YrhL
LFAYSRGHRPWYFVVFALGLATASYYLVEQPMLRVRDRRASQRCVALRRVTTAAKLKQPPA